MATFWWIRRTGRLHIHWLVVKTRADAISTGPRSKEEKKRREKQESIQKWPRPPLSQLPNPCSNDPHSRSLYLSVGLSWNCQGGRASACDLALMGASAAGIGRSCPLYMSIASRVVPSHSSTSNKWSSLNMIILTKFKHACTLLSLGAVLCGIFLKR